MNAGQAWSTGPQNTHGIARYTGTAFPQDQYSEITYGVKGSAYQTDVIGPAVRMTDAGGYWVVFYSDQFYLWAVNPDGTLHHQIGIIGGGINPGDTLRLSVQGTKLTVLHNGTAIMNFVDVTFPSGAAGIIGYNQSANPTQGQAQAIASWHAGASGTAGGLNVVVRNNEGGTSVDTVYPQDQWNLDKLDGTGLSGVTIDTTKDQIFVIDLQWLGTGRIRFGFDFGRGPVFCHVVYNANLITGPYMQTATLPVRYEISNVGPAATASQLMQICVAVITEDSGTRSPDLQFAASTGGGSKSINTATPILSIRPKLTFGGNTNHLWNIIRKMNGVSDKRVHWKMVYNGTLTGANFVDVDTARSGMQYDVSASAISGGVTVEEGYVGADESWNEEHGEEGCPFYKIPFTINLAEDTADIYTLVVEPVDAEFSAYAKVSATMNWVERR